MTAHLHPWHLVKTFIGDGEPRTMQMIDPDSGKTKMWIDARQEHAKFVCDICGTYKIVAMEATPTTKGADNA